MTEEAVVPVPPEVLKRLLEKKGYRVVRETDYNWTLALDNDLGDISEPLVIPKCGNLVSVEIMLGGFSRILPNDYFVLKAQVEAELKKKAN
jgi:hypothetical protein